MKKYRVYTKAGTTEFVRAESIQYTERNLVIFRQGDLIVALFDSPASVTCVSDTK